MTAGSDPQPESGADPSAEWGEHDPSRHIYYGLHRPPWKRVLLTGIGVVLTLVGGALWLTPLVPGGFLAYIGIPMLYAASPRREAQMRRWVRHRFLRSRVRWRRRLRRWRG